MIGVAKDVPRIGFETPTDGRGLEARTRGRETHLLAAAGLGQPL